MPRFDPSLLVKVVIDALDEGDASAILISSPQGNPRHFIVQSNHTSFELWAYIWTLTHGGGAARPVNEYRIQITGVQPPIAENPSGPTLLLGYEPNLGCFAGFDLEKHKTFSTRSPSIQIPITTLHDALQHGFSFTTKGNDEIAIGIRPDQFLAYCLNANRLHKEGASAQMVDLLTKAASLEDIETTEIEQMPLDRKRIITEVSRSSRDSSFRRKVVAAYERRCAVTRIQLRLVDAAHILPVGAEGNADEISNGLCLSPTYHRAYDRALIYLDESLRMQINPEKEKELISAGLSGGLANFKTALATRIHLPQDKAQWPNIDYIRAANTFRSIA